MYQNFIGIDIGKDSFCVALHTENKTHLFSNSEEGFQLFEEAYRDSLSQSLIVLETTGGYEQALISYLQDRSVCVHRAQTRKVKHYIRSLGIRAKTDSLDAKSLASYGADRHERLELFVKSPRKMLQKLLQRRADLKGMLVQEKNRLQAPDQKELRKSFEIIIKALQNQLKTIDQDIERYCQKHTELQEQRKVLETVAGIGKVISVQLLALLPEMGELNSKKIASLAGVAPHPQDSGKKTGYRSTSGGRKEVKKVLFMAALTASRSKSRLGEFYQNLVARGKKKMVALVALMRKILVVANARLREQRLLLSPAQHG